MTQGLSTVAEKQESEPVCVVRLRTTSWHDKRGVYTQKSLSYLKRQSNGFNILEDEAMNIGADEIFPRIVNLNKCADGVFQVVVCNQSRDWETGYVDDYDLKLIPFAD